jgi:hypothetical protein
MVSVPETLIALAFFAVVGLKVTTTWQASLAAARVSGQFWTAENPAPVVLILVMTIATALALARFTDICLDVPAWVFGKTSDFGPKVSLPRGSFFSGAPAALETPKAVPNSSRLTTSDTMPAILRCRDFAPSGRDDLL